MDFKKVRMFIENQLEKERIYYPAEIFEGLTFDVSSGSNGVCLLTITGKYCTISAAYVGNYKAIESKIIFFVSHSYFNLTGRYWEKTHQKEARYLLEIYNDNNKVNTLKSADYFDVLKQLATIYIDAQTRGTKTRFYNQLNGKIKIVQTWEKERSGCSFVLKYVYYFEGVNL